MESRHKSTGETPLIRAAAGGHLKVVEFLINEYKADVNAADAEVSHWKIVEFLIHEFNADINAADAEVSHWKVVEFLINEFKADVNAADAEVSHWKIVEFNINEYKADVDEQVWRLACSCSCTKIGYVESWEMKHSNAAPLFPLWILISGSNSFDSSGRNESQTGCRSPHKATEYQPRRQDYPRYCLEAYI